MFATITFKPCKTEWSAQNSKAWTGWDDQLRRPVGCSRPPIAHWTCSKSSWSDVTILSTVSAVCTSECPIICIASISGHWSALVISTRISNATARKWNHVKRRWTYRKERPSQAYTLHHHKVKIVRKQLRLLIHALWVSQRCDVLCSIFSSDASENGSVRQARSASVIEVKNSANHLAGSEETWYRCFTGTQYLQWNVHQWIEWWIAYTV